MPRFLFVLPTLDPEVDVRLDTDVDSDTPAEVFSMGGGGPIVGARFNAGPDGSLPRVVTTDGTDTLYVKVLNYAGSQVGDPVEVAGVDEDAVAVAPSGADIRIHASGPFDATDVADVTVDTVVGTGLAVVIDEFGGWEVQVSEPGLYFASGSRDTTPYTTVRIVAQAGDGGQVSPTISGAAPVNMFRVVTAPAIVFVRPASAGDAFQAGEVTYIDMFRVT